MVVAGEVWTRSVPTLAKGVPRELRLCDCGMLHQARLASRQTARRTSLQNLDPNVIARQQACPIRQGPTHEPKLTADRKPPTDPLTGQPACYRHPASMIPYASAESYATLQALLANRYVWSEGGWWAGGEADVAADGIEDIAGWREACMRGWAGGKRVESEEGEAVDKDEMGEEAEEMEVDEEGGEEMEVEEGEEEAEMDAEEGEEEVEEDEEGAEELEDEEEEGEEEPAGKGKGRAKATTKKPSTKKAPAKGKAKTKAAPKRGSKAATTAKKAAPRAVPKKVAKPKAEPKAATESKRKAEPQAGPAAKKAKTTSGSGSKRKR